MNTFDIIVVLILLGFILNGIRKGLFHEIFSLIGIIGGISAGILAAGPLSRWLTDIFPSLSGAVTLIICFVVILVAFFVLTRYLARFFKSIMEKLNLGWLDRILGGVLAGFTGAIVISLILMFVSFLSFQKKISPLEKDSALHEPLYKLVPKIYRVLGSIDDLPKEVSKTLKKSRKELLEDKIDNLKENVEDAVDDALK